MNAKQVLRNSMDLGETVVNSYLDGLSDADLLIRPVEGANHIAWQLGHLISSERRMLEIIRPGASPALPAGFEENHGKEKAGSNDPQLFSTKAEYARLAQAQREATKKVLDEVTESELDDADPKKYPPYAPNMAALLNLIGNHYMMHAGQFAVVRRKLKLPIVM